MSPGSEKRLRAFRLTASALTLLGCLAEMSAQAFCPKETLNTCRETGAVSVEQDRLRVVGNSVVFQLFPAVLFQAVVGGGADPNNLLGKVKDDGMLAALGAGINGAVATVADTDYEIESVFLARVEGEGVLPAVQQALAGLGV